MFPNFRSQARKLEKSGITINLCEYVTRTMFKHPLHRFLINGCTIIDVVNGNFHLFTVTLNNNFFVGYSEKIHSNEHVIHIFKILQNLPIHTIEFIFNAAYLKQKHTNN